MIPWSFSIILYTYPVWLPEISYPTNLHHFVGQPTRGYKEGIPPPSENFSLWWFQYRLFNSFVKNTSLSDTFFWIIEQSLGTGLISDWQVLAWHLFFCFLGGGLLKGTETGLPAAALCISEWRNLPKCPPREHCLYVERPVSDAER